MSTQFAPELPSDLDDRKAAVLRAIISDYVATGDAVGSKRVLDVADLGVSAATVRNEMAALESAGYISQPHTSAGRIPTDKGYRFFVDELRHVKSGHTAPSGAIARSLADSHDVEELLQRTTRVMARLTNLVSLVVAPAYDRSNLKLIELVRLGPHTVLMLIVTDAGRVEKQLIEVREQVDESDIAAVSRRVNDACHGLSLLAAGPKLAQLASDRVGVEADILAAMHDAVEALRELPLGRMFVGGRAALADEGSLDRGELSRMLELIEDQATLAEVVIRQSDAEDTVVTIGREHEFEELRPTSLVAQRYRLISTGSVGVLGPTRMDYATVINTVQAVATQLERALADLDES